MTTAHGMLRRQFDIAPRLMLLSIQSLDRSDGVSLPTRLESLDWSDGVSLLARPEPALTAVQAQQFDTD